VTLQPALVIWSVKLPSIMLLLLHCMLEHVESASGAGTQNRLQRWRAGVRKHTRQPAGRAGAGERLKRSRGDGGGEIGAYSRLPGPQLHWTQRLAVIA
jgi:hypothetical protein